MHHEVAETLVIEGNVTEACIGCDAEEVHDQESMGPNVPVNDVVTDDACWMWCQNGYRVNQNVMHRYWMIAAGKDTILNHLTQSRDCHRDCTEQVGAGGSPCSCQSHRDCALGNHSCWKKVCQNPRGTYNSLDGEKDCDCSYTRKKDRMTELLVESSWNVVFMRSLPLQSYRAQCERLDERILLLRIRVEG